jgi:glycerophosphoryl diester phosphodiesterase
MVVAHRGASHEIAEHTLAAYVAAISSGADALECDVRLTRDGHLVCVHDRTVNRTSDARGVVSEFDLDTLSAMDFSSWHGRLHGATDSGPPPDAADGGPPPDAADRMLDDTPYLAGVAPDRVTSDGGVLTLERLLGLVRDASAPVRLLIETKHPTPATAAWWRRSWSSCSPASAGPDGPGHRSRCASRPCSTTG